MKVLLLNFDLASNSKFIAVPGSGGRLSVPSLDESFKYDDSDAHDEEIAELYSYAEGPEFSHCKKAFEDLMKKFKFPTEWLALNESQRQKVIFLLLDRIENSRKAIRMRAARSVLYLVQGVFGECQYPSDQLKHTRKNVFLLYDYGFYHSFIQLLNLEIENSNVASSATSNPVSLGDSTNLRIVLNVLYTFIEEMRLTVSTDTARMKQLQTNFVSELATHSHGGDLLAHTLFQMVTKFCNGTAPHFPIKKVLLLLWKTILVTLGGSETLKKLKNQYRAASNLPPVVDDTIDVVKTMQAASPPATAGDLVGTRQQEKKNITFDKQRLAMQFSMNSLLQDLQRDSGKKPIKFQGGGRAADRLSDKKVMESRRSPSPSTSMQLPSSKSCPSNMPTFDGLPWIPKVSLKNISASLEDRFSRLKRVDFCLSSDRASLLSLLDPKEKELEVLKQHVYVPLSEIQIEREASMIKHPFTQAKNDMPQTVVEVLYAAILPDLPSFLMALSKILLAAAPISKTKIESINIMADVFSEEISMTTVQSMKLRVDVARHKEIIVKAISGILLLLLKHLKINHIYQFEFMSQQLMFAKYINLVLSFFNQDIQSYIRARNKITGIEFPECVIGEQPELSEKTLEISDEVYCWRNVFSCINLLRVLNKITKSKSSRIKMLVVFGSASILKKVLKVKHAMMQLYVLKLIKMQTKYLGREWRKSNIETISLIYQKVRHRLNDDWAHENDLEERSWEFKAEESALQASIKRFHDRHYDHIASVWSDPKSSVENNFLDILRNKIELQGDYKYIYEAWLRREFFQAPVDWDQLIELSFK